MHKQYETTEKICPDCGAKLKRDITQIKLSDPPQFELRCPNCGHIEHEIIGNAK